MSRRILFIVPFVVAVAGAQSMTEVGASAAGSAIGSAAGKKVSDGITAIFGKVNTTTGKAAKQATDDSKAAPLIEVGPTTTKTSAGESVPPPPPASGHRAAAKPAAAPEAMPEIAPPPPLPPPPPPQMTVEDLRRVTSGMRREELLKFGQPVSRIMMDEDGHLVESYSYADKENSIGRVKLTDGVVSSVEIL
jgi:hypothetical protein